LEERVGQEGLDWVTTVRAILRQFRERESWAQK
jgi:hypothetical protein